MPHRTPGKRPIVLLNAMATRAGGAITRIGEIARRAPARWHTPVLLAHVRSVDFGIIPSDAEVVLPAALDRLPAPARRLFEPGLLRGAIRSRGVGVIVHFGSFVPLPRRAGVAQVLAFTNLGPWQPGPGADDARNRLLRALFHRTIERADLVLAESTASVAQLLELRPSLAGRVAALPNGVALPRIERRGPARGFVVVGDVLPHRRIDEVVRAWTSLPADVRAAHPLEVIGHLRDPGAVASVRAAAGVSDAAAEANDADAVRLTGPLPRREVLERVANAAAFVSWSSVENGPNAVLEALALGTPAVLSDIPAHREYAGGGARYAQDGAGLVAALLETARQPGSPRSSVGPIDTWDEHVRVMGELLEAAGIFGGMEPVRGA